MLSYLVPEFLRNVCLKLRLNKFCDRIIDACVDLVFDLRGIVDQSMNTSIRYCSLFFVTCCRTSLLSASCNNPSRQPQFRAVCIILRLLLISSCSADCVDVRDSRSCRILAGNEYARFWLSTQGSWENVTCPGIRRYLYSPSMGTKPHLKVVRV